MLGGRVGIDIGVSVQGSSKFEIAEIHQQILFFLGL